VCKVYINNILGFLDYIEEGLGYVVIRILEVISLA
jgi:hypothetical protein